MARRKKVITWQKSDPSRGGPDRLDLCKAHSGQLSGPYEVSMGAHLGSCDHCGSARKNPFFAPPALQYVAAFNPPRGKWAVLAHDRVISTHSNRRVAEAKLDKLERDSGGFGPRMWVADVGPNSGTEIIKVFGKRTHRPRTNPRFKVRGGQQEFACPNCSSPVYSGEIAWESAEGDVFCGKACATEWSGDSMSNPPSRDGWVDLDGGQRLIHNRVLLHENNDARLRSMGAAQAADAAYAQYRAEAMASIDEDYQIARKAIVGEVRARRRSSARSNPCSQSSRPQLDWHR